MPDNTYVKLDVLRRWRNSSVVGFVILTLGIIGAFAAQNHERDERRSELKKSTTRQLDAIRAGALKNCNATFDTVSNTRNVLIIARRAVAAQYEAEIITKKEFDDQSAFYTETLAQLSFPDCREIVQLIKDDPDEPVEKVAPKHP